MLTWDYIYINERLSVYGRNSKINYGTMENYGTWLTYAFSLEEALYKAYSLVEQYGIFTAPRISEKIHVPLELVS